ncbi:MAG: carboxypeptidase regulatory-like protein [Chloroflexi bacterium]|nr:carboxypeptidase regulatory-like protein [Chloroflexota bacterium]
MRKAQKYLVWSAALIVALVLLNIVYPCVWISLPIEGRIVDDRTGTPIAGAVVVASWTVSGVWERYPVALLAVEEAVSAPNGTFRIDGWGPRFHFGSGRADGSEPLLRLIARGYEPLLVHRLSTLPQEFGFIQYAPTHVEMHVTDVFALRAADTRSADYDRRVADFIALLNSAISIPMCRTWSLPHAEAVVHVIDDDLAKNLPTHAVLALRPYRSQGTCGQSPSPTQGSGQ